MKKVYRSKFNIILSLIFLIFSPILGYYRAILSGDFDLSGYLQLVMIIIFFTAIFFFGTKSNQYYIFDKEKLQVKSFKRIIKEVKYIDIDDIHIESSIYDFIVIRNNSKKIEIKMMMDKDILLFLEKNADSEEFRQKVITIIKIKS